MTTIDSQNAYLLNLPSAPLTDSVGPLAYPMLTSDELLAFCTIRLQSIDSNIGAAMNNQQLKQKEQTKLQDFQNAVEKFSPNGPTNEVEFQTIKDAYAKMTANPDGLPSDDPIVAQAGAVLTNLQNASHDPPPDVAQAQQALTSAQDAYDAQAKVCAQNPSDPDPGAMGDLANCKADVDAARTALNDALSATANPPFKAVDKDQWDALAKPLDGYLTTLKGGAEMDMLNLQSLVSQRQTVVQLVTGMMGKFDQTQEAAAAKIGS